MKKNVKLLALGLCLMLGAFAIAGCSSADSGEEATAGQASGEPVEAVGQRDVYVTPEWLNSALAGEQAGYEDVVVAEVVYDASADKASYDAGHVPGAIVVSDVEVEDAVGSEDAPYNLLAADEVEGYALSHGITKDTKVVLYGADPAGTARVAYGYLWLGVEDVKVLNGGIDAWTGAGFDTETTANEGAAASDFGVAVPAHPEYWVSMDDAARRLKSDDNFKLVSIRSEPEWLGETSGYGYIDRAGEPEGAVWGKGADTAFDTNGFLNADGTVMTLDEVLAGEWSDVDFTVDNDLAFYCGTGWRACVPFLFMYQAGYDNMAVYDGGWYEWQMHDDMPVQVGDPASSDCQHVKVADLPTDKAAK